MRRPCSSSSKVAGGAASSGAAGSASVLAGSAWRVVVTGEVAPDAAGLSGCTGSRRRQQRDEGRRPRGGPAGPTGRPSAPPFRASTPARFACDATSAGTSAAHGPTTSVGTSIAAGNRTLDRSGCAVGPGRASRPSGMPGTGEGRLDILTARRLPHDAERARPTPDELSTRRLDVDVPGGVGPPGGLHGRHFTRKGRVPARRGRSRGSPTCNPSQAKVSIAQRRRALLRGRPGRRSAQQGSARTAMSERGATRHV